jgi:hypothetical protein
MDGEVVVVGIRPVCMTVLDMFVHPLLAFSHRQTGKELEPNYAWKGRNPAWHQQTSAVNEAEFGAGIAVHFPLNMNFHFQPPGGRDAA